MGLDQKNKIEQVLTLIVVFYYHLVRWCKLKILAEKVYTQGGVISNFVILNSLVTVLYLRLIKNPYFHSLKEKIAVLAVSLLKNRKPLYDILESLEIFWFLERI